MYAHALLDEGMLKKEYKSDILYLLNKLLNLHKVKNQWQQNAVLHNLNISSKSKSNKFILYYGFNCFWF